MTSTIQDAIIIMLEEMGGEFKGTEELALALNAPKNWTIKCVRVLKTNGEIKIIPARGGRGHRTVYKRNRNQPGLPRKTR